MCREIMPGTNIYGDISTSAERSEQDQDQSGAQPYKTAADLFWGRRCGGDSLLYFYKGSSGDTGISAYDGNHHAAVFSDGNVRERRLPGRKDTVFYHTTEISAAGDKTVSVKRYLQETGGTGRDQKGGTVS